MGFGAGGNKVGFEKEGLATILQHDVVKGAGVEIANHISDLVLDNTVTVEAAFFVGHHLPVGVDHKEDALGFGFDAENIDL